MALILNLKSVENLKGKSDRQAKVSFRGLTYQSKVITNAKQVCYFGESFEWPIARSVDPMEMLEIQLYNYNKYLSNKLVGSFSLILQQVVNDGNVKISESFVDSNNRIMETLISFEVRYFSPDGKVGLWSQDEFEYPLMDQWIPPGVPPETVTVPLDGPEEPVIVVDKYPQEDRDKAAADLDDAGSVISFGTSVTGGDSASQVAAIEALMAARQAKHEMHEVELHKAMEFQINITIHEGQQLAGLNIDPVVRVAVGDDVKYTSIKQSTNTPYFCEFFVFDFFATPILLFDKIISLHVYDAHLLPGHKVLKAINLVAGTTVGEFKCDIGTVYAAPGHMYYRKWAVLLNPKDIAEGPRGFLKCDISVVAKGEPIRVPKPNSDEDNIEGNLLLPVGVPMERQRAAYRVILHRAEDLPRMDTGIIATVKKAMLFNRTDFIDAYVRCSFVGHTGKTGVKKSYFPEWKEQLTFIDMFPPLCNRIKIQLYDSDAVSDEVIATHFVELPQIMDPGGDIEGILPTFGPTWINFYGASRSFKFTDCNDELNEGIGEGAAFRGRLLVAIKTELLDGDESAGPSTVYRDKVRTSGRVDVAPKREYIVFTTLFGASMINKDYKGKETYFELSIGVHGNTLDAHGERNLLDFNGDESDESGSDEESKLIKKKKEGDKGKGKEEDEMLVNSTTDPEIPCTEDENYYYIPTTNEKPCLYVCCMMEDLRKRIYHTNLLDRIVEKLEEKLEEVRMGLKADGANPHRKLRTAMDELSKGCDMYTKHADSLNVGAGSGKTKLDKHRLLSCRANVEKMKELARKMRSETNRVNVKIKYRESREILRRLKHIAKEPQHSIPDVFLWMVVDKKRVAYVRVPAKELLYANQSPLKGKHCGKIQTLFLKKPGRKGVGAAGWSVQAKLDLYMWLGLRETDRKNRDFMMGLPPGFTETSETHNAHKVPPYQIHYPDETTFQLRAHLFQARNLIGCDESGLSDPFARIIIGEQCQQTEIKHETLSPTWNQTVVFQDVTIFSAPAVIVEYPPVVLIEIFDFDTVGQPEFLGRAMVKPRVKLSEEVYEAPNWPARLQWWDVYRGSRKGGEILAAFELLQSGGEEASILPLPEPELLQNKHYRISIPPQIKPVTATYRLEVMFWGIRQAKRVQLLSVDKPRVDIELAGNMLRSKRIHNMSRNSNFEEEPLMYMDVELPENELYWPPITIRCVDCRNFGREVMVGTATITNVRQYLWLSPREVQRRAAERARTATIFAPSGVGARSVIGNGAITGMGSIAPSAVAPSQRGGSAAPTPAVSVMGSRRPSVAGSVRTLQPSVHGVPALGLGTPTRATPAPSVAHSTRGLTPAPSVAGSVRGGGTPSPSFGHPEHRDTLAPPVVHPPRGGSPTPSVVPSVAPSIARSVHGATLAPPVVRGGSPTPSVTPSVAPSLAPSVAPSFAPSHAPSVAQSVAISVARSRAPSIAPSEAHSVAPSVARSLARSHAASQAPSARGAATPTPSFLGPNQGPVQARLTPAQSTQSLAHRGSPTASLHSAVVHTNRQYQSSLVEGSLAGDVSRSPARSIPGSHRGSLASVPGATPSGTPVPGTPQHGGDGSNGGAASPDVVIAIEDSMVPPDGDALLPPSPEGQPNGHANLGLDPPPELLLGPDGLPILGPDGQPVLTPVPLDGMLPPNGVLPPGQQPPGAAGAKSAVAGAGAGVPVFPKLTLKQRKRRKELIDELDWWSKYYLTLEERGKESEEEDVIDPKKPPGEGKPEGVADQPPKKKEKKEKKDELDDDDNADTESHTEAFQDEFMSLDFAAMKADKLQKLKEIQSADEGEDDALTKRLKKKAKKRKKKKKKAAMKKRSKEAFSKFKEKATSAFSKDEDDEDMDTNEMMANQEEEETKSYIARIEYYQTELEKLPEFSGCNEWVETHDLYKGKSMDDDEPDSFRISAKFKGNLLLYRLEEEETDDEMDAKSVVSRRSHKPDAKSGPGQRNQKHDTKSLVSHRSHKAEVKTKFKLSRFLFPTKSYEVSVRLYIIRALDLHPVDLNGLADPYLHVSLGRRTRNDKEGRISNTLNPVFGKMFEIEATFPVDSIARIQVWDYDKLSADDMIGETTIDLENRIRTRHRATCGFPDKYEIFGYNTWRDPQSPKQILAKLCKDIRIAPPAYSIPNKTVTIAGLKYYAPTQVETEGSEMLPTEEHLALEVLKNWEDIPGGCCLVPEHVETRVLYHQDKPGVEQGRLEMWVDMFPMDLPQPSTSVDITPRKPIGYELRCIVWNADDVVMDDTNPLTGEASSDIFIKGYMYGPEIDGQETDTHYRSLSGEGNFNWRFVFPFEFLKAEEKIVMKRKEHSFSLEEKEEKSQAALTIQVWDADLVSADDYLGAIALKLSKMPRPTKDVKKCSLKMLKRDGSVPTLNLFKQKKVKGWWPIAATDEETGEDALVGKVELELQLVTGDDAEKTPVGLAREGPEPLGDPNRPDTSFLWFMSPLKTLRYILWRNLKYKLLKAFIFLLFLAILALFLYTTPGILNRKLWGV